MATRSLSAGDAAQSSCPDRVPQSPQSDALKPDATAPVAATRGPLTHRELLDWCESVFNIQAQLQCLGSRIHELASTDGVDDKAAHMLERVSLLLDEQLERVGVSILNASYRVQA